jgi:AraC-type DNA-binding domain-containing proteins
LEISEQYITFETVFETRAMNLLFYMSLAATAMETAACLICAHNLWRIDREQFDASRRKLYIGALMSGLVAMVVVLANLSMAVHDTPYFVLHPWIALMYTSMNIVMVLYPLSVIRPEWLTTVRAFFLFLPVLILGIIYAGFSLKWTLLRTPEDIWVHILEPDVLARLAALAIMVPYCLLLFALPYNYKSSSASKKWVWIYSMGLLGLTLMHIALMLTNNAILYILLPLLSGIFYVLSTEYELEMRLRPTVLPIPGASLEAGRDSESALMEMDLWARVKHLMEEEEAWRDPDLSMDGLSRLCATNVTYLNNVIKKNTGGGFKELINGKRVACVASQIKLNPDMDIQCAFFNAGYRSRTTAWRNFKEIIGQSPAEYKNELK